MKVLITGSSGMIGAALKAELSTNGHDAVPLVRKRVSRGSPVWDPDTGSIDLGGVRQVDAVVHLAGENLASGRWSEKKKCRILDSRVKGTRLLCEFFAALKARPKVIVSASAVGAYGDRGPEILDETSSPGTGFLADVCRQWEEATSAASDSGIRVVNVRVGIVLSTSGGVLKRMLPPFELGLGGVIGSGKQYLSWVHIDDVAAMIQFVIGNDSIRGPVNLVAPEPVSNLEFTATLGRTLHRPTLCRVPGFAARMVFGEMADALLLSSTRAVPARLNESGYKFRHPHLAGALRHMLTTDEEERQ